MNVSSWDIHAYGDLISVEPKPLQWILDMFVSGKLLVLVQLLAPELFVSWFVKVTRILTLVVCGTSKTQHWVAKQTTRPCVPISLVLRSSKPVLPNLFQSFPPWQRQQAIPPTSLLHLLFSSGMLIHISREFLHFKIFGAPFSIRKSCFVLST